MNKFHWSLNGCDVKCRRFWQEEKEQKLKDL